jgi:hypothetical protein
MLEGDCLSSFQLKSNQLWDRFTISKLITLLEIKKE